MIAPIIRTIPRAARRVQTPMAVRSFQTSTTMRARKDAQDRESIDRSSIEYTRSGTDSGVADNDEAAFGKSSTRPEEELKKAGEGNKGNPLEFSPANQDMSPTGEAAEGGPRSSGGPERKQQSGGSNGPKGKKIE